MIAEFDSLKEIFQKILSAEVLSAQKIRETEANLSDLFCEITNNNKDLGIQKFEEFLTNIEQTNSKNISVPKFVRLKSLFNQYKDEFFDRFSLLKFYENNNLITNSINDIHSSNKIQEYYEPENDENENLLAEDQNQLDFMRHFFLKLECFKSQKEHRTKEIFLKWRLLGIQHSTERQKKIWRLIDCFIKIYFCKYKALCQILARSQAIGRLKMRPNLLAQFENNMIIKRQINDQLKKELDELEEENKKILLQRTDFRNHITRPNTKTNEVPNARVQTNSPETRHICKDDCIKKKALENDESLYKMVDPCGLIKHSVDTFDENFLITGCSRNEFNVKPPFESRLTRIFPIFEQQNSRIEENIVSLIEKIEFCNNPYNPKQPNLDPPRYEDGSGSFGSVRVQKNPQDNIIDNHKKTDNNQSGSSNKNISLINMEENEGYEILKKMEPCYDMQYRKRENTKLIEKNDISILRRVRILKSIFNSIKKSKMWLIFAAFIKRVQKSKLKIENVSKRIMAKLLFSTRQNLCGFDMKRAFFHWYIHGNPFFAQKCVLKMLSHIPIRYYSAVYRLKLMVLKQHPKKSKIEKLISINSAFVAVRKIMDIKIIKISQIIWKCLRQEKYDLTLFEKCTKNLHFKIVAVFFNQLKNFFVEKKFFFEKLKKLVRKKKSFAFLKFLLNHQHTKSVSTISKLIQFRELWETLYVKKMKFAFFHLNLYAKKIEVKNNYTRKIIKQLSKSLSTKLIITFERIFQFSEFEKTKRKLELQIKAKIFKSIFEKNETNAKKTTFYQLKSFKNHILYEKKIIQTVKKINFNFKTESLKQKVKAKIKLTFDTLRNHCNLACSSNLRNRNSSRNLLFRFEKTTQAKKSISFGLIRKNNSRIIKRLLKWDVTLRHCNLLLRKFKFKIFNRFKEIVTFLYQNKREQIENAKFTLIKFGSDIKKLTCLKIQNILKKIKHYHRDRTSKIQTILIKFSDFRARQLTSWINILKKNNYIQKIGIKSIVNKLVLNCDLKKRSAYCRLQHEWLRAKYDDLHMRTFAKFINEIICRAITKNISFFCINLSVISTEMKSRNKELLILKSKTMRNMVSKTQVKQIICFQKLKNNRETEKLNLQNRETIANNIRLQTLRKKKGAFLVFITSQFHKLKTVLIDFRNKIRKLCQNFNRKQNFKFQTISKIVASNHFKKQEVFRSIFEYSFFKKRQRENQIAIKKKLYSKYFGQENTRHFANIDSSLFDRFIQKVKMIPGASCSSNLRHLIVFLKKHNVSKVFDHLLDFYRKNCLLSYHSFIIELVSELQNNPKFKEKRMYPLKFILYSFILNGRIKNHLIKTWYYMTKASNPELQNDIFDFLKAPDGKYELYDCLRYINQKTYLENLRSIFLERIQSTNLKNQIKSIAASQKERIEFKKIIERPDTTLTEICMCLKIPKNKANSSLIEQAINRKVSILYERILCLISSFLEIIEILDFDIFKLMGYYGASVYSEFICLLDRKVIDWPFELFEILKDIINQNFEEIAFQKINRLIKFLAESPQSKMKQQDIQKIKEIFNYYEACKQTPVSLSNIQLYMVLAKQLRLKNFCSALEDCFYIRDVIRFLGDGKKSTKKIQEILEEIQKNDVLKRSDFDQFSNQLKSKDSSDLPNTIAVVYSFAKSMSESSCMRDLAGFMEKLPRISTKVEDLVGYLRIQLDDNSEVNLIACFDIVNQDYENNRIMKLIKFIIELIPKPCYQKIINRVFTTGRTMEYSNFIILINESADKIALNPILQMINEDYDPNDLDHILHFIYDNPELKEIAEKLSKIACPDLLDVVTITEGSKKGPEIEKIKNKINGLDETAESLFELLNKNKTVLDKINVSEKEKFREIVKNIEEYVKTNPKSDCHVSKNVDINHSIIDCFRLISKFQISDRNCSLKALLENSYIEKESDLPIIPETYLFFNTLSNFLVNNPEDQLVKKIKNGEITTTQQMYEILVDQIAPRYQILKQSILRIPKTTTFNKGKKGLLEKKIEAKLSYALLSLRKFLDDKKKQDLSIKKRKKRILDRMRSNLGTKILKCVEILIRCCQKLKEFEVNKKEKCTKTMKSLCVKFLKNCSQKQSKCFLALNSYKIMKKRVSEIFLERIIGVSNKFQREMKRIFYELIKTRAKKKIQSGKKNLKSIFRLTQNRVRFAFDIINNFSYTRYLNKIFSQLICLFNGIKKNQHTITRKYYDILTRKNAKQKLAHFLNKMDAIVIRRKTNAFSSITYVYYRAKYQDKIQAITWLINLTRFHQLADVTFFMEQFFKEFKKRNPWFEKLILKMVLVASITDQNSFWKIKALLAIRESLLKPSDSLKLKRFAQIFEKGAFKNRSYSFFMIYNQMRTHVNK